MQKEFGYARVSTAGQHEDRQVQALLEYGIEERNIIVNKQSGKDFNRVGYLSLKENILRRGDTLVVKELEWFKAEGIRVKILNVPTTLIDCGDQDWVLDFVGSVMILKTIIMRYTKITQVV